MPKTPDSGAILCSLALLVLSPLTASAQNSDEVRTYLMSVKRLYENLEYEIALEQISRARHVERKSDDDVTLSLYEGLVLAGLGKKEKATEAFKMALLLNPEAQLPVRASPKVEKHFESLREQARQEVASLMARREAERQPTTAEPPRHEGKHEQGQEKPPLLPQPPPAQNVQTGPAPHPVGVSGQAGLREHALVPAIAGGVLLLGGGVSWSLSRLELKRLQSNDPKLATLEDVRRSASRGQTYQMVGLGLMGAGLAGLGVSAGMYVWGAPARPLALGLGTDGTSAFVYGRWP